MQDLDSYHKQVYFNINLHSVLHYWLNLRSLLVSMVVEPVDSLPGYIDNYYILLQSQLYSW